MESVERRQKYEKALGLRKDGNPGAIAAMIDEQISRVMAVADEELSVARMLKDAAEDLATDAIAEVERLRGVIAERDAHGRRRTAQGLRERNRADAAEARLAAAEWLIRTDHSVGRHDTYGAGLTCKGCAWLSSLAEASR